MNHVLRARGQPPAPTLARLFADANALVLRTLPELDHYPARPGGRYAGVWPTDGGDDPEWATGRRPRVFAYLKPTPGIGEVLAAVGSGGGEIAAYVPGLSAEDAATARAAGVRLPDRPADMRAVAERCDLAVLNGTHGTTAAVVLAGKPIVQVPIYLEQVLVALRTVALGPGRIASRADSRAVADAIREVWVHPSYRAAAERFARRYQRFDPRAAVRSLADRLDALGSR